jgi:hypothetical protein
MYPSSVDRLLYSVRQISTYSDQEGFDTTYSRRTRRQTTPVAWGRQLIGVDEVPSYNFSEMVEFGPVKTWLGNRELFFCYECQVLRSLTTIFQPSY